MSPGWRALVSSSLFQGCLFHWKLTQGRVNTGTNTNKATRNSELKRVALSEEGLDTGENGAALNLAVLVLGDQTGADLDLVVDLDDTGENGATGNTTLQLINLGTGLVNVEASNDHHVGQSGEIADGNRDVRHEVLVDGIDVVLELGGDGDNWRVIGDGSSDELENGLVVLESGLLAHKVDLVLANNDVLELHDLNGGQL